MIIILRNADFSENNVGQIVVPLELSLWTKEVIAKYPNFAWTTHIKNALERLYLTLNSSGVLSQMRYFSLPMFASSLQEAVQNLVIGNDAYIGSNAYSKYEVVSNKGIKRVAAVSNTNDDIIIVPFNMTTDHANFHVMFMPSENIPAGSYRATTVNKGDANDLALWLSIGCTFTFLHAVNVCTFNSWNSTVYNSPSEIYPLSMTGNSGGAVIADNNFGSLAVPVIQNVANDTVSISISAQDYVSTTALHNFLTSTTNPYGMENLRMLLMPLEDSQGNWYARPHGAFSYGKSLTNDLSKAYQNALMHLLNVVNS